jgi:hypothetical protein
MAWQALSRDEWFQDWVSLRPPQGVNCVLRSGRYNSSHVVGEDYLETEGSA